MKTVGKPRENDAWTGLPNQKSNKLDDSANEADVVEETCWSI